MGRTVMPFSFVLDEERGRWKGFRKGLSKEDQEAFDRLFDRAKFHAAAGVYIAHPYPLETILRIDFGQRQIQNFIRLKIL